MHRWILLIISLIFFSGCSVSMEKATEATWPPDDIASKLLLLEQSEMFNETKDLIVIEKEHECSTR